MRGDILVATYVVSDIHGERSKLELLLERIGFSDDDALFLLGDVIDRGPDGVDLLRKIRTMPNVQMLLGNHEHMMLTSFGEGLNLLEFRNWMRNGGEKTAQVFIDLPEQEQEDILNWLRALPIHLEIAVGCRKFHWFTGGPEGPSVTRFGVAPKVWTIEVIVYLIMRPSSLGIPRLFS